MGVPYVDTKDSRACSVVLLGHQSGVTKTCWDV